MPLHLAELKKHTEQNQQIIELLQILTNTQQPKEEVVSDIEKKEVNKGGRVKR